MGTDESPARAVTSLMIGVPTMGTVQTRLAARLLDWMRQIEPGRLVLHFTEDVIPHDRARNQIVDHFLKSNASHLMMVDSDMIPPADAPERMLAHGRDFVTAMTPVPRTDPESGRTVVVDFCFAESAPSARPLPRDSGLQRIARCGAGCLLLHRSVFDRVEPPWFRFGYDPGLTEMRVSEDVDFCDRLRAAGVELWADTDVICRHQRRVLL